MLSFMGETFCKETNRNCAAEGLVSGAVVTGQLAAWRGILDSVKQFSISLSSL